MNGNMKLLLELVANNRELRNGLNSGRRDVHTFVAGAKKEFESLKGALGSIQGKLATLGIGIGVGKIIMDSARLDKSLTQIGQTAGASSKDVGLLRSELFRMGRQSGQSIEELQTGFNVLVQSGLNMKESRATLDGVNIAMAVTGSNANTLAAGLTVAAQAFQFDLSKPGQALELLDKMTVAGRLGNAELENLSQIFARVGINAQAAGLDFNKTLGFIEALSKVERQPERLATLADSTLRVFTNMNYMSAAQKGTGIRFYDKSEKRRDPLQVLSDIKKKYDTLKTDLQRDTFVQKAFGKADLDTIKGIRTLLASNNLAEVGRTTGLIKDASGTLKRDFGAATRNLVDQFGMLKNDMRSFADGLVKPMNETLGQWIQFMRDSKENGGLGMDGKTMAATALAIGGGTYALSKIGGKYLPKWAQGKLGSLNASTARGVAEGTALKYAGVTPVFVVNADSIGGGVVADAGNIIKTGGAASTGASAAGGGILARAGYIGAIAAAVLGTVQLYRHMSGMDQPFDAEYLKQANHPTRHTVMGGYEKGFNADEARPSTRWQSWSQRQDAFTRRFIATESAAPQVTNDIKIDINLDELGRTFARTNSMNTNTSVNSMRRGSFMTPIENSAMGSEY